MDSFDETTLVRVPGGRGKSAAPARTASAPSPPAVVVAQEDDEDDEASAAHDASAANDASDDDDDEDDDDEDSESHGIFREEALEQLAQGQLRGDVLRLQPDWVQRAYWIVVAAVLAGVSFAAAALVHEVASGPAVVRLDGRVDLTATTSGTVNSIEVRAGERVAAGQLLVRFYGAEELHTLQRIDSELEVQLTKALADSTDQSARAELARLRAEKGLAEARLDERSLRAPRGGTVREIRIRPGQLLQAGDLALTLLDDETPPSLVVVLPGHFRPQLRPGLSLRFAPDGFRFAYQELTIDSVSDEVLGPAEVKRYLGPELDDAIPIQGPSVIVTARLPDQGFVSGGKTYRYQHGLPGSASARVRTRSLLAALLPGMGESGE
jgi:membrane fusion protein (multidrug efflux system)